GGGVGGAAGATNATGRGRAGVTARPITKSGRVAVSSGCTCLPATPAIAPVDTCVVDMGRPRLAPRPTRKAVVRLAVKPSLWFIRTTFSPSRRATRTAATAPPAAMAKAIRTRSWLGWSVPGTSPKAPMAQILGVSLRPLAKLAAPLVNQWAVSTLSPIRLVAGLCTGQRGEVDVITRTIGSEDRGDPTAAVAVRTEVLPGLTAPAGAGASTSTQTH